MYENFYGLKEKPFQITPNPKYLYLSSVHENALMYLEYGLMENVGFILLTGDIGTGKTTLVRYLLDQFGSEKEIAVIFNTNITVDDLLCLILQSFDLKPEDGNKTKNLEIFQEFLIDRYSKNKQVLLIIDEAQNLSDEVLEEVRMFSNLQSDDQNLIQIMLVGQPELKDRLKQHEHNPLSQRIAVNFFLSGLTDKETQSYIAYRLEKAGGRPDILSPEAVDMIYGVSRGIPRTINLLCDTALVYGFGYELETIDVPVIEQVIRDKGGMGIFDENKKIEDDRNKLKSQEITTTVLERQVKWLVEKVEDLEENTKRLREDLDIILKVLLFEERKRNDHLLRLYNELRARYENLLDKGESVKGEKREKRKEESE